MSLQQLTVACVTILSSKEIRGEKTALCTPANRPLTLVGQYHHVVVTLVHLLCVLCSTVAGQEDCWLLTETLIQTATLQLKVCLNVQCLALHSFTDLHPGKQAHSHQPFYLSSVKYWSLTGFVCPASCSEYLKSDYGSTSVNDVYHFSFITFRNTLNITYKKNKI